MTPEHRQAIHAMAECGKSPQEIVAEWPQVTVREVEIVLGMDAERSKYLNRLITYEGKTKTIAEWARQLGMTRWGLAKRLKKMPIREAMLRPVAEHKSHRKTA